MPKNRGVTRSMRNPPGCRQPQGSRELAPSSTSVCTNAEKADKGADAIYIVADDIQPISTVSSIYARESVGEGL